MESEVNGNDEGRQSENNVKQSLKYKIKNIEDLNVIRV